MYNYSIEQEVRPNKLHDELGDLGEVYSLLSYSDLAGCILAFPDLRSSTCINAYSDDENVGSYEYYEKRTQEEYTDEETGEVTTQYVWSEYDPSELFATIEAIVETHDAEVMSVTEIRQARSEAFVNVDNYQLTLHYAELTDEQKTELATYRQAWLDATVTLEIPTEPDWM